MTHPRRSAGLPAGQCLLPGGAGSAARPTIHFAREARLS